MRVIYEPKGKAREYSPLALNLYIGCSNGCKYCYVPRYCRLKKEEFRNNTSVRKNILKKLELDALELKIEKNKKPILMCFTCDPYQKAEEIYQITRRAIEILNKNNQNFQILTKNGNLATRDFDLYKKKDTYAITLTFDNETDSKTIEPKADIPQDRINSLEEAHKLGIQTWVSLEPVIIPSQSLNLIDLTHEFVDLYKVGKLNHYPKTESKIDWREFGKRAINKLKGYNKEFYIKKDLRKYLE